VPGFEDVWIPLVDEPIGGIVSRIHDEHPEIAGLVNSPRRLLAFRTFAYIRVGILLGRLLVEHDVDPYDGSETWVEKLLRDPTYHQQVVDEVRAVAEEIAADASYAGDEPVGPDEQARDRVRATLKKRLESL
jgi:hypothetical protein